MNPSPLDATAPADAWDRSGPIRRRSRALIQRGPGTRVAPLAVLTTICAIALVFGVLLEQVILAQSAFKLSRVRRDISVAEAEGQRLLLWMTRLSSPRRIERYARERLGMVPASRFDYLVADIGASERRVALVFRRPGPSSTLRGAAEAAGVSP